MHEYSPVSADAGYQGAQVVQIESGKLVNSALVLAFIAIAFSAASIGLAIGARDMANRAEEIARHQDNEIDRKINREARLLRVEIDEQAAALSRAGIRIHRDTDKP